MTSVRDYLDSIRKSLDDIGDLTDVDLEPVGMYRDALESIDAYADQLARAWGAPASKRKATE